MGLRRCGRHFQLGFWVGLGDNDNIDDNTTLSAGHTIHMQQSNRVKER